MFAIRNRAAFRGLDKPPFSDKIRGVMINLLNAPLYAVSQEWEYNGYDDSDFYRVVFNPNTGQLTRYETFSTRYGCGYFAAVSEQYAKKIGEYGQPLTDYKRDFDGKCDNVPNGKIYLALPVREYVMPEKTPESVWQAAENAFAEMVYNSLKASHKHAAQSPGRGKQCRVIKGRKVKVGSMVRVLGAPVKTYFRGHDTGEKVLVETEAGAALKVAVENLEVINPGQYVPDESELRAKAREIAAARNFYPMFATSRVSMV